MTAPVERVRWLAVALLSLTSAACKVERDLCDELHEALQRCGLPPAAPDCGGIDAEADAYLVDRLDALGCDGIAGPQDAVDPRICELADWPCPPALGPEPGDQLSPHGAVSSLLFYAWSHSRNFSPSEARAWLEQAGFAEVDVHRNIRSLWRMVVTGR